VRVDCADAERDTTYQAVFVANTDNDGQPAGFVTCRVHPIAARNPHEQERLSFNGDIRLVGVAEGARGHGLAAMLVNAALKWFASHDCKTVTVVTQARNVGAQRVYQRCGFITQRVQWSYHKWFEDT
jgi:GNAT superfamily N-acetyltransferase